MLRWPVSCCRLTSAQKSPLRWTRTKTRILPGLEKSKRCFRRFKINSLASRRRLTGLSPATEKAAESKQTSCWAEEDRAPPSTVRAKPLSRTHCVAKWGNGKRCWMLGWGALWFACRGARITTQKGKWMCTKPGKRFSSPGNVVGDRGRRAASRRLRA